MYKVVPMLSVVLALGASRGSVQTVPGQTWFTILRRYGPLEPWFNKTWRPGEIEPQP